MMATTCGERAMQQWEYKIHLAETGDYNSKENDDLVTWLQRAGSQNLELVSTTLTPQGKLLLIFKRPKQSAE
jgi:hypothetical protein